MLRPAKYSTSIPTVAPTTVFRIRERNAVQAACSSGSVIVITEINADKGLCPGVVQDVPHQATTRGEQRRLVVVCDATATIDLTVRHMRRSVGMCTTGLGGDLV